MKPTSHSRCVFVVLLAASATPGCGKKSEEPAQGPPAATQQSAGVPFPIPVPPGATGAGNANPPDTRPPVPPAQQVTLAEVLAKDAEKWAATADEREASRKKLAEFEVNLAEAVRRRVPKGLMLPPYVLGDIDLYRKSSKGLIFGFFNGLSPDGKRLTIRELPPPDGKDETWYRIVELQTGEVVCRFEGGRNTLGIRAFSPDGTVLAVCNGDKGIGLWDAKTGQLRHRVQVGKHIWGLAPFVDGNGWIASLEGSLVRLDGSSGAIVKEYCDRSLNAGQPVVSQSGSIIAAYANSRTQGNNNKKCISFWDSATGVRLGEFDLKASNFGSKLFFSPDGRTLYSHESDTIVAWDLTTSTHRTVIEAKGMEYPSVSPDGQLLAYYAAPHLVLHDLGSGRERRLRSTGQFWPDTDPVFFPGGTLLATTSNGHFVVWDVSLSRP